MRDSTKRRLQQLEVGRGADAERDGCPILAVGILRPDGLYESGGRLYTQSEIDRCFGDGQGVFVVLDEGPTVEV